MERMILAASIVVVAALLLAGSSLARAQYPVINAIAHRPATATLSGTVERVISPTEFTLRSEHRMVVVHLAAANPPVLDEGDDITVTFVPGRDARAAVNASVVLLNQRANT